MTRVALKAESPTKVHEHRGGDAHARPGRRNSCYSASWDNAAQVVRFAMGGGALSAAITRDALEMLAGCHLQTSPDALREFRRHRSWVETLATLTMEERCELAVVLTQADVCFQLAREAETRVEVLCV
jgi:hypothetical protein